MKQGTQKAPKLRFKQFNDDWDKLKIDQIGITINGLTGKSGVDFNEGDPYITYKQIFDKSEIDIKNFGLVKISNDEKQNKIQYGDILFTTSSESPEEVGFSSAYLERNINPYLNSFSFALRPISLEKTDTNFLKFIFISPSFRRKVIKLAQGSTRYNISKTEFKKIDLMIPNNKEQIEISNLLNQVENYIENLKSQKEELEKYKKGIMQKIFSQQIRFKDENGNNFPDWENKNLNNISKIIKGMQLNKSNLETNYKNGLFAVINGGTLPSGYTEDFNTTKNTITISEGGNSCGYVNLIKEDFWCGGHCYKLTEIDTNCDYNYLFNYLKFIQKEIMKLRVGSGLPNIQRKDIEKISIPIPSNKEQNKISKFFNEINKKIEINESKINLAEEWKKGLMQQMLL